MLKDIQENKFLTTSKERLDYYLKSKSNAKPSLKAKRERLELLKLTLVNKELFISEVFPTKQLTVIEYIIYLTSKVGISAIGTDELVRKCQVSRRTAISAVKNLSEYGDFFIARLRNPKTGSPGIYVFVDKKHENFEGIMMKVFPHKI